MSRALKLALSALVAVAVETATVWMLTHVVVLDLSVAFAIAFALGYLALFAAFRALKPSSANPPLGSQLRTYGLFGIAILLLVEVTVYLCVDLLGLNLATTNTIAMVAVACWVGPVRRFAGRGSQGSADIAASSVAQGEARIQAGSTGPCDEPEWTLVIRPKGYWFDLRLRELWEGRELIWLFFQRDFVALYKQTILGPAWYLIQPLMTTIVFTVVFGRIANLPTNGLPQFLFYMSGTVAWTYFATSLTKTSTTFMANANLFGKVYFARLTVPLSILLSNLVVFGIQFILFLGLLAYFMVKGADAHVTAWALLLPVLIIIMAGLGLGLGIIVSALTTKYRDLQYLVVFGVQLLMYTAPIIIPLSSVSGKWRWIMAANPMTSIIEAFRRGFLGAGMISAPLLLYSAGFALVASIGGALLFHRVERTFMDTV
jgi:lipopolysaccharide transport system permease protein